MNKQDILGVGYLKGEYNHFKKLRLGDYRILLSYCVDCYKNNHNHKLQCKICDEHNLERIIAIHVFQRKKGYRPYKMKLREIEF